MRTPREAGLRRLWRYSPHRALIALGAILISVAVAAGGLGVANSTTAEHAAGILINRYLVLQPAEQSMQTSVAAFQAVAELAFGGAGVNTATLDAAVQDSTSTDQAYLTLQHLLDLGPNRHLDPGLGAAEAAYANSRTGLATILKVGVASAQGMGLATAERAAYRSLESQLGSLQLSVNNGLTASAQKAHDAARAARDDLVYSLLVGVTFAMAVTVLLARKAWRVESDAALRDAAGARSTRRNEFEGRLQRALEMAKAESSVFELVTEALGEAAPGLRSELLLADSSRAHFRLALDNSSIGDKPGCSVVSPEDCPAASRGQTMVFPISTAMDSCPNLRGRDCSALCVPVSISGNSVGVVHVVAAEGTPPGDAVRSDVEVVARRASERLAMLRAFELSQTEANSDSLTGLLTRRSLETRMRELRDGGLAYAVAYADLDHFKQLNDVFGHDAGDRALRTFSQVLRDALRPTDLPCRYGGEEFVIVLPACPLDEAVLVLERVRYRMAMRLNSGTLPGFTVSFGVASSDQAAEFEQVVALADEALLTAKAAGRDQIVVAGGASFRTDAHDDARELRRLEQDTSVL